MHMAAHLSGHPDITEVGLTSFLGKFGPVIDTNVVCSQCLPETV